MSEKHFYYGIFDDGTEYIEDYWKKKYYFNLDDVEELLNEQQATINNQEQRIKILQQEISDTRAILEMLTEKLKGWNDERETI